MSTLSGGPNIVTNGLVLSLDAANTKSYISGSTVWRDISRDGNNGTLINGVGYNGANGGSLTFDGVDDCVFSPTSTTLQPQTSLTLECMFKLGSIISGRWIVAYSGDVGGSYVPYGFRVIGGNTLSGYLRASNSIAQTSWPILTTNQWVCSTLAYDGSNANLYVNGALANSVSITGSMDYSSYGSPYYLNIARKNVSDSLYTSGSIAMARFYNRALTSQEVLQNFNATKTRFGL